MVIGTGKWEAWMLMQIFSSVLSRLRCFASELFPGMAGGTCALTLSQPLFHKLLLCLTFSRCLCFSFYLGNVVVVQSLSHIQLFAIPWTVACQAPLSMGFPRQEYWSGLSFPSPGDLPNSGIEPASPALADGFFTTEPPGKPKRDMGSGYPMGLLFLETN